MIGIDAILFGHAHAEFPSKAFASHPKVDLERGTINGVPSVMPGRWGDHLGVIDVTLDNASGNTGSTRQLQLLGLLQRPDNALGAYARWKVRINYHQYTAGQAGV